LGVAPQLAKSGGTEVAIEGQCIRDVFSAHDSETRGGERQGLPLHLVDETVAMVHALAGEFRTRCADAACFGAAKRITLAMLDERVDISDPAAVARWIAGFNQRDEVARHSVVG
jgi:hypothetical protein